MKKLIFTIFVFSALFICNTGLNAQVQTYTVINNTDMVISGVSLAPSGTNQWGESLAMSGNIAVGKSFEFSQSFDSKNCNHDIRFMGSDGMNGKYYYMQNLNLCTTTTISLTKNEMDIQGTDIIRSDDNGLDTEKDRKMEKDGQDDKVQTDKEKLEKDPMINK